MSDDYLALDLRVATPAEGLGTAGLDITTGYAVDSFFGETARDPWAIECVQRFCDVVVQHDVTVYPTPDYKTLEPAELEAEEPYIFTGARSGGDALIQPFTGSTAEDVELTSVEIEQLWSSFEAWVRRANNAEELHRWFQVHDSYRIRMARRRASERYIDKFWAELPTTSLLQFVGETEEDLRYAYDVYVRTLRYHRALGDKTVYFPHPVRTDARARSANTLSLLTWSWGKFLVTAMTEHGSPDREWLLDQLRAIRAAARRAGAEGNWYNVTKLPRKKQRDIITQIAVDADLQPKLLSRVQKDAKLATSALTIVAAAAFPVVKLAISFAALLPSGVIERRLPRPLTRAKFLQGYLHWPGLLDE